MKTFAFISLLLTSGALPAQNIQCLKGDCGRFSTFVSAAQTSAQGRHFEEAINQYNAAKVCCPSATEAIDAEILRVFKLIEDEKIKSDANAEIAKKAKVKADIALKKANTLIGHFYFTQDRAWAYKNGKFAIIDREGNLKGDKKFIYDRPDTFQTNGYALVFKGKRQLLIDTEGHESPEYEQLFPTNNNGYWAQKDGKYAFLDFRGQLRPGMEWYTAIDTFSSGMALVQKDKKWGYIDVQGKPAIAAQFSNANAFRAGHAWVEQPKKGWGMIDSKGQFVIQPTYSNGKFVAPTISFASKSGKWGIIDKTGNYIVKPEYDGIQNFQDGMVAVLKDDKWGFVNDKGELAIPPQFESASAFSEEFAIVRVDSTTKRFIDKNGNFHFSLQIDKADNFSEGLAPVKQKEEKYGYIDYKGEFKIKPQFEDAQNFSKGIAWVKLENRKWGLIDTTGKVITDTLFEKYRDFVGKMAAVRHGGKWGFITSEGKFLVPTEFDEVQNFENGYAGVQKGGLWGFIDSTGKLVVKPEYSNVYPFSEGLAAVEKAEKWSFVNTSGDLIAPIQYTQLLNTNSFKHGVAWVYLEEDRGWRLLNRRGELVGDVYYRVNTFSEGMGPAMKRNNKWGFVDSLGNEAIPFEYLRVGLFQDGLTSFSKDSTSGYINKSGKVIFEQTKTGDSWQNYNYYGGGGFYEGLVGAQDSGKWGYIDKTGNWAIKARFDAAQDFIEGQANVMEGELNLFIDKTNKTVAQCQTSEIYVMEVNGNMVHFRDEYYGQYGFLNLNTGKTIGPFASERTFKNGVLWSGKHDDKGYYKIGLVDENGEYLIQPKHDQAKDFENEIGWVREDNGWWAINKKGERISKERITSMGDFSEGLARADQDGLRGYVDRSGQVVIPFQFESGSSRYRSDGMYPPGYPSEYYDEPDDRYYGGEHTNSYAGYADYRGDYYGDYDRQPAFLKGASKTGDFRNGLTAARKSEKWGYIDKTGTFKIREQFDWAGNFSEDLAWVVEGEKRKLINKAGDFVPLSRKYDDAFPFSGGVAVVIVEDDFGMIDRHGKEIVPLEYEALAYFSEGLAAAKKDGKWGYINPEGEEVIPAQFEVVYDFKQGKATVKKDGIYFIINKKGQLIVDENLERQPAGSAVPDDSDPPQGNR